MMRTWNRLGLPALLAAALAAAPARGQIDGDPDKTDTILSQLKALSQAVKDLGNLKDLPKGLADLDKKIDEARRALEVNTDLRVNAVQRDLQTLREQYAQLKQDLDALRGRQPARSPTTALYPPNGTAAGRVRLVNTFPRPVDVVVNGRIYTLNPGETRHSDPLPAGLFTYEIIGIQERTSRALSAGETFQVHVYPR